MIVSNIPNIPGNFRVSLNNN